MSAPGLDSSAPLQMLLFAPVCSKWRKYGCVFLGGVFIFHMSIGSRRGVCFDVEGRVVDLDADSVFVVAATSPALPIWMQSQRHFCSVHAAACR